MLGKKQWQTVGENNPAKRPEVRKKISKAMKGRANHNGFKSGEKHWNWKGGATEKNKLLRNSRNFKKWRESIFKYDDYTCWICGEKGGKIHPHHLLRFSDYPELRFVESNGITLCEFCHIIYTEFGGKTQIYKPVPGISKIMVF